MDVLGRLWQQLATPAPQLAPEQAAAAAAAALLVVVLRPSWRLARHAVTIVHEGSHGLAATLTGRRLHGIRLHSDTSGLAVSSGRPTGPGMVLTAAAGHLGPAVLGLGAAAVLVAGHPLALLWGLLVALALLLVQVRNWFGVWSVLLSGSVVVAAVWQLPARGQSVFAHLLTWVLLLGAVRTVLELQAHRRGGRARTSDADQLARLTGVPGLGWVVLFLGAGAGAVALAGRWLLPLPW